MAVTLTNEAKGLILDHFKLAANRVVLYGREVIGTDPETLWTENKDAIAFTTSGDTLVLSGDVTLSVTFGQNTTTIFVDGVILINENGQITHPSGVTVANNLMVIPFVDGQGTPEPFEYSGTGNFTLTDLTIQLTD